MIKEVGGRQEPQPGTQRYAHMHDVKRWLLRRNKGTTYRYISKILDLSLPAVQNAVLDLNLFDPTIEISVPSPRNGYMIKAHWGKAHVDGEANQLRHNGTRCLRQAERLEKGAKKVPNANVADQMIKLADIERYVGQKYFDMATELELLGV